MNQGTLSKAKSKSQYVIVAEDGEYFLPAHQLPEELGRLVVQNGAISVGFEHEGKKVLNVWLAVSREPSPALEPSSKSGTAMSFRNPYNFVPVVKRSDIKPPLGDDEPAGHHILKRQLFTGCLLVSLEVVSPLLLVDPSRGRKDRSGHQFLPALKDAKNKPLLPATSIKGVIRSSFEAVTNSRLGVVEDRARFDESLLPAADPKRLSPAERVFGWANPNGKGAYRGQVRIHPGVVRGSLQVKDHPRDGVALAVLSGPKPHPPFYQDGGRARGRKAYPHQRLVGEGELALPAGEWQIRRRTNQNRSIQHWVRPTTVFEFQLRFMNLSRVELGALIWLLDRVGELGGYLRIGGGKPLGFGSTRSRIQWDSAKSRIRTGEDYRRKYESLSGEHAGETSDHRQSAETAFKEEIRKQYGHGRGFEEVSFIAAFLKSTQGYGDQLPTKYPSKRNWFDRLEYKSVPLQELSVDRGLPPELDAEA